MLFINRPPCDIEPQKSPANKPGTYWRRQNLSFLKQWTRKLDRKARILDVGSGTGYFKNLFIPESYVSVDFNPYPGTDIICDFSVNWPFKPESVDMVLLSNVLEHIRDGERLLDCILKCLKPGGTLLITVPFMIKIHQAPYDFVRYTHFALSRMLKKAGFRIEILEAVYEPAYLARTTLKNLRSVVHEGGNLKNRLGRTIIWGMWAVSEGLLRFGLDYLRNESIIDSHAVSDAFPLGYHIMACRP